MSTIWIWTLIAYCGMFLFSYPFLLKEVKEIIKEEKASDHPKMAKHFALIIAAIPVVNVWHAAPLFGSWIKVKMAQRRIRKAFKDIKSPEIQQLGKDIDWIIGESNKLDV